MNNNVKYIKDNEKISATEIVPGAKFYLDKTGMFEVLEIFPEHHEYNSDGNKKRICKKAKLRFYNCVNIEYYDDIFYVDAISKQRIKNKYFPNVCNIACIGNTTCVINSKHKHLYSVWKSMINRCYNINNNRYNDYGAKGVIVCDRWLCFEYFEIDAVNLPGYQDMINNPNIKYNIDKDILQQGISYNQKIYSPETCIWIPMSINSIQVAIDNKHKRSSIYHNVCKCKDNNYKARIKNKYTGTIIAYNYTNEIAAAKMVDYFNKYLGTSQLFNNIPDEVMTISQALQYRCYRTEPKNMIKRVMCKIIEKENAV